MELLLLLLLPTVLVFVPTLLQAAPVATE